MAAVTVKDLVVRFDAATILDRVGVSVASGELLMLLGPSGCGKTTLLRSIAGFIEPDAGSIRFDDEEMRGRPTHTRNVGMVFQSFALWPHMTVAENVAFGLRERRVPKAEIATRVEEALASTRMAGYGARAIDELSGGEQQRVALARALVVRPRCLLLDEPLSNLDAKLRQSMREEIRRLCKSAGLTTIYVTHDQKEALAIADRIAVMQKGQILQIGTPTEVYRRPQSRAVATFIGETNLLQGRVAALLDRRWGPRRQPDRPARRGGRSADVLARGGQRRLDLDPSRECPRDERRQERAAAGQQRARRHRRRRLPLSR